jgi:hypothetical protein
MLVSSGRDATMILWSADGNILQRQELPKHALHTVDISPHGTIFAAGMAQSAKSSKDARGASLYASAASPLRRLAPVSMGSVVCVCSRPLDHTKNWLKSLYCTLSSAQHSVCVLFIVRRRRRAS